jgi:hypothetical protein
LAEVRVIRIDAKAFQEPLGKLAATLVEMIFREGHQVIPGPHYVKEDLATLLRYAASVYNLLNYLNAEERRKGDCNWYVRYGVTAMSLVRSLIDCLYNTMAILDDPSEKGASYRKSGFRKVLQDMDDAKKRHSGEAGVLEAIAQQHGLLEGLIRYSGFTMDEILAMPNSESWPTFGRYIRERPGTPLTDKQLFLKNFAHVEWRQYSALSHGAYEAFIGGPLGQVPVGAYYMNDFLPHESRDQLEGTYDLFVSTHIGRSSTVLLCIATELQAYCRFDGANIDRRICEVWSVLLGFPGARELFDARYGHLMRTRNMVGVEEDILLKKGMSVIDDIREGPTKNPDEGTDAQGA